MTTTDFPHDLIDFVYGCHRAHPDHRPARLVLSHTAYTEIRSNSLAWPDSLSGATIPGEAGRHSTMLGLAATVDDSLTGRVWRVCTADGDLIADNRSGRTP